MKSAVKPSCAQVDTLTSVVDCKPEAELPWDIDFSDSALPVVPWRTCVACATAFNSTHKPSHKLRDPRPQEENVHEVRDQTLTGSA